MRNPKPSSTLKLRLIFLVLGTGQQGAPNSWELPFGFHEPSSFPTEPMEGKALSWCSFQFRGIKAYKNFVPASLPFGRNTVVMSGKSDIV